MNKSEIRNGRDIYVFDDPVEFLQARLALIDPPMTHREFAASIGLQSPATLTHILNRYRKISPEHSDAISATLGLNASEARFYEVLIRYSRAKTAEARQELFEEMQKMRVRSNCFQIDLKHYAYFATWYFAPLLELLHFKNIHYNDAGTLGRYLHPTITSQDAKRAIDRMIELEMINLDARGFLRRIRKVVNTDGLPVSILRNLNREFFDLANSAQDEIPREERNISSVTMAMSKATFDKVSRKIDELRLEILASEEPPSKMDRVVQFTFAAHPLTKTEGMSDE